MPQLLLERQSLSKQMTLKPKLLGGMKVLFNIINVENLGGIEGKPLQHPLEDQRLGLEGTKLVREEVVRYHLKDPQVRTAGLVMERIRVAQQTEACLRRNATDEILHAFNGLPNHRQHRVLKFFARKSPGVLVRAVLRRPPATIEELIHPIQELLGRIISPLIALDDRQHQRLIVPTVFRTVDA